MQAQLETAAYAHANLKVRKIDLPRSSCAAGDQFRIRSVPHLVLYEGTEEVAVGTPQVIRRLNDL